MAVVSHAADLYRIAGVVINAQTGSPLPHSRVSVFRYGTAQVFGKQTTGTDGKFAFEVPQGKFSLIAGTRQMQQSFGIRTPDASFGTAIVTGTDHDTSNLEVRWFPPGAIWGRIQDEAGEPAEGALVQLLRSTVFGGRRVIRTVSWAWTDDRGEYRFGPLRGGTYFLAVTGTPWYSREPIMGEKRSSPSVAYNPLFFPNSSDVSRASPILLKAGREMRADFSLSVVAGANVIVTHDAPQELSGRIALLTEGVAASEGYQRTEDFEGMMPAFVFDSVPPGRYTVVITGTKGTSDFSGRRKVDVNGMDQEVSVQVRPAPSVSGTIHFKDANARPKRAILATLIREESGGAISTTVRPDGTFLFPSVAVAKWRPMIRSGDGYFASEIRVDGTDFHNGVIDLSDGQSVTIQMMVSDESGRVQGFVVQDETLLEGVLVVLAPVSGSHDQIVYRGFQTDSDGSFDFQNVPSGEYLLIAVEDTGLEYADPNALAPYLPNATHIKIEPHQVESKKISLTKTLEKVK